MIVGLGNPGNRYSQTRHNVGFKVIENLALKFNLKPQSESKNYLTYRGKFENNEFSLLLPQTYMNLSGIAVKEFSIKHNVTISSLLIVCDDINLPLGKVRLRSKGSDGGHNGLYSIINELGSKDFPRLRVGIGNDFEKERLADFVLSPFSEEELRVIEQAINFSAEISEQFLIGGLKAAMEYYSKKLKTLRENPN